MVLKRTVGTNPIGETEMKWKTFVLILLALCHIVASRCGLLAIGSFLPVGHFPTLVFASPKHRNKITTVEFTVQVSIANPRLGMFLDPDQPIIIVDGTVFILIESDQIRIWVVHGSCLKIDVPVIYDTIAVIRWWCCAYHRLIALIASRSSLGRVSPILSEARTFYADMSSIRR